MDGKQIPNGRQARQQKTAKFMNMGEAEVENEADLRTWLLSEKDKPEAREASIVRSLRGTHPD